MASDNSEVGQLAFARASRMDRNAYTRWAARFNPVQFWWLFYSQQMNCTTMRALLFLCVAVSLSASPLSLDSLNGLIGARVEKASRNLQATVRIESKATVAFSRSGSRGYEELLLANVDPVTGTIESLTYGIACSAKQNSMAGELFSRMLKDAKSLGFTSIREGASVDGVDLIGELPVRTDKGVFVGVSLVNKGKKISVDITFMLLADATRGVNLFIQKVDHN